VSNKGKWAMTLKELKEAHYESEAFLKELLDSHNVTYKEFDEYAGNLEGLEMAVYDLAIFQLTKRLLKIWRRDNAEN
tara:strand:- start:1322 stop:1552 length:231 start_codon:yes stop_codon:yes gene_type:complete